MTKAFSSFLPPVSARGAAGICNDVKTDGRNLLLRYFFFFLLSLPVLVCNDLASVQLISLSLALVLVPHYVDIFAWWNMQGIFFF